MREIVAVLLIAALALPLAANAPGIANQIDAIFTDAGAAPVSPPLMYAGIRG